MANSVPNPKRAARVGALCLNRTHRAGRARRFHVPARLALSQSHAAPLRLDRTQGRGRYAPSATTTPPASPTPGTPPNTPPRTSHALEKKTRQFAAALRESTIPGAIKDAASANLSTLVTPVCFRTADGEFHGFEGANDHAGCCHGSCTHVWNYETVTAASLPHASPARCAPPASATTWTTPARLHFRENLPHKEPLWGFAAADGTMGQIMHAYLDWRLSGDIDWLRGIWPRVKKALEFAWIPGGWDADRDGVLEGVQHNTYDVEFYGPNPLCGIYYLGGAARRRRDGARRGRCRVRRRIPPPVRKRPQVDRRQSVQRRILRRSRSAAWPKTRSPPSLRSAMGSEDTEKPQYQVGAGCLLDQLVGQYMAGRRRPGSAGLAGQHSQDAANPSIATTTNARSPVTIPCSAPTRSTMKPRS